MYRAFSFLELANTYIEVTVSPESVSEIKQVSEQEQVRLDANYESALSKYQSLNDLVGYIEENIKVGSKLPSERILSEVLGWNRSVVRESLGKLECFGYVSIEHGKSTVLIAELPKRPSYSES